MTEKPSFKEVASQRSRQSIMHDFLSFMKDNKKWWLLPFLIMFLLLGGLVLLSGTGAAPFLYTLF